MAEKRNLLSNGTASVLINEEEPAFLNHLPRLRFGNKAKIRPG